jgi:hypothetical protein
MIRPRAIGTSRTVCVDDHLSSAKANKHAVLTKEALDRVFAHTNEKCEKTTTLRVVGIRENHVQQDLNALSSR